MNVGLILILLAVVSLFLTAIFCRIDKIKTRQSNNEKILDKIHEISEKHYPPTEYEDHSWLL